jgi:GMP synthase-like glutamine amidotransferase
MNVGILNAIPPQRSGIDWGGSPVDAYIRFFESGGAGFDYAGYEVAQGEFPGSPNACDAYVITGSPKGVYDDDAWIATLAQFIRDSYQAGKKLVGICFGHQILAHALGGRAEKSDKGWGLGLNSFDITRTKPWMAGKPEQCALYFSHQDQVTRLPPGAERLGGSEFCPNAFYVIGDQALGIQGHPEFTSRIMHDVLSIVVGHVGIEVYETAVNSMNNGTPDNQLVARWLVNFLLQRP